jgi:hypothetical protein
MRPAETRQPSSRMDSLSRHAEIYGSIRTRPDPLSVSDQNPEALNMQVRVQGTGAIFWGGMMCRAYFVATNRRSLEISS